MRLIYTFFFYLLAPFILFRLYWKGRKLKSYRERLAERFSCGPMLQTPVDVWLHAVSLGEVVAATPLIDCFLQKGWRVCVTTMTPTGSAQVLRRFDSRVVHQYVPYDFPYALRRFYKKITPRVGVIMETELWPNLIAEATRARIPLFLANARISDQAYPQYHAVRWFLKPILNQFRCIMAQSPLDEARYKTLVGPSGVVKMLGNLKFDLTISKTHHDVAQSMKQALGEHRPIVILASTHENEEQQILEKLRQLQKVMPSVVVLLAPRHPERFQSVFDLCCTLQYRTARRTALESVHQEIEVVVLDSLGELMSFYAISDYAFVGGSFVPIGGHNVLEPIALNVPVLCGPWMQNSQSIIDALLKAHALIQVDSSDALIDALANLHQNSSLRALQIQHAADIMILNQGALLRHMEVVNSLLSGHDQ